VAAYEHSGNNGSRLFLSLILILVGIGICSTAWIVMIDVSCRADIERWMPIYPDARIVEIEQAGSYRQRATGITQILYATSDTPVEVRRWYREYRRELTSGLATGDRAAGGFADTQQRIYENSMTGGAYIYQYSECATT